MEIAYPKIAWYDRDTPSKPCVAFEKYDGTNLAFHWQKDVGFTFTATRRRKFDISDPTFGEAIILFDQYRDILNEKFKQDVFENVTKIVVFAEFLGPNSFAGLHQKSDLKELKFIDLWANHCGFLKPESFLRILKDLPLPKIIYRGKITGRFVEDVKSGKYKINEGVVCKGDGWSCKIKTQAWLQKLAIFHQNNSCWIADDEIERSFDEELKTK